MLVTRFGINAAAFACAALALAACQGTAPTASLPASISDAGRQRQAIVPKPGDGAGNAQIYVWNGLPGYSTFPDGKAATLEQFAYGVSGDAAPVSRYAFAAPPLVVRRDGSFWAGPFNRIDSADGFARTSIGLYTRAGSVIRRLSQDTYLGAALGPKETLYAVSGYTVQPVAGSCVSRKHVVSEYLTNEQWGKPVQRSPVYRSGDSSCIVPMVADARGDVFVGYYSDIVGYWSGEIDEYAFDSSGRARILRKVLLPLVNSASVFNGIGGLALDSSGDLFALVSNHLMEYASGTWQPQSILPNLVITAFALDARNDIYAAVQTSPPVGNGFGKYAIEEFAPGSTTPERTIAGPHTHLTAPTGIAVAP